MAVSASSARAAALSIALAFPVQHGRAADLPHPVSAFAESAQKEFGSGWHLRGGIAAAEAPTPSEGAEPPPDFLLQPISAFGQGYQFNNWFRSDATAGYERLFSGSSAALGVLPCQIGHGRKAAVASPAYGVMRFGCGRAARSWEREFGRNVWG